MKIQIACLLVVLLSSDSFGIRCIEDVPDSPRCGDYTDTCTDPETVGVCQRYCGVCGNHYTTSAQQCTDYSALCPIRLQRNNAFCSEPADRIRCQKTCGVCNNNRATTKTKMSPSISPSKMPSPTPKTSPVSLCTHDNVTTMLSPGEKTVDVQLANGLTSRLPVGEFVFMFPSHPRNCTFYVSVIAAIDDTQLSCPSVFTGIASPVTGLGDLELTLEGTIHQLSLPIGEYNYRTFSKGKNCTILVRISDHSIIRRLEFRAEYQVSCDLLSNPVIKSTVKSLSESHYVQLSGPLFCGEDCSRQKGSEVKISCVNGTMSVMWPTNVTYSGDVTDVPPAVAGRLRDRLEQSGSFLKLFIMNRLPPVALPDNTEVLLTSSCLDNKVYVSDTDRCE